MIVVAAIVAAAGCGADDEPAPEGGGSVQAIDVSLRDFALDPANPTLSQPGTITINATNDGQTPHSIEVEGPEGEVELEQELAPGESGSIEVPLTEEGAFTWYCPVGDHEQRGMRGRIAVGAAGTATGTETQTQTQTQTTETQTTETQTGTETTETETTETETSESGDGY